MQLLRILRWIFFVHIINKFTLCCCLSITTDSLPSLLKFCGKFKKLHFILLPHEGTIRNQKCKPFIMWVFTVTSCKKRFFKKELLKLIFETETSLGLRSGFLLSYIQMCSKPWYTHHSHYLSCLSDVSLAFCQSFCLETAVTGEMVYTASIYNTNRTCGKTQRQRDWLFPQRLSCACINTCIHGNTFISSLWKHACR